MRAVRRVAFATFTASVYGAIYGLHTDSAAVLGMCSFGALTSFHALCGLSLG